MNKSETSWILKLLTSFILNKTISLMHALVQQTRIVFMITDSKLFRISYLPNLSFISFEKDALMWKTH